VPSVGECNFLVIGIQCYILTEKYFILFAERRTTHQQVVNMEINAGNEYRLLVRTRFIQQRKFPVIYLEFFNLQFFQCFLDGFVNFTHFIWDGNIAGRFFAGAG